MNPYESPGALSEYLLFHYGGVEEVLGEFPGPAEAVGFAGKLVEELLDAGRLPRSGGGRALDVGCAVGGSTFALARRFEEVIGLDFSRAFVAAARELAEKGSLRTEAVLEGDRAAPFVARVEPGTDRSRVRFAVADAMDLPADLGPFDAVLAANLLCRLREPGRFLERLPDLVRRGGQLLLTTPFSWTEEFTPRENWLGGKPGDGPSFDVLAGLLEPAFDLDCKKEIPFLIRERARKFQYTIACGTRWIRH